MGSGRWDPDDWSSFSSTASTKSTSTIFTSRGMVDALNPLNITFRESRDSVDNPQSTAIIVGLDVTGSMGMIATKLAQEGLGILFQEILDRKPVTDPHLMFMGIGDVYCDQAPLQVSQFEADNRIVEQLTELYVEGGGGGNDSESYTLPWYFAAMKTSIDCFEKRGKKGYLFTIGDELPPSNLSVADLTKVFGSAQSGITSKDLLTAVERMYHVFHIIVEQGNYAHSYLPEVKAAWSKLLGQRAIPLSDYTKLSEVIVSTIQVIEGEDSAKVAASWSPSTALVVKHAIKDLTSVVKVGTGSGAVRF